MTEFFKFIQWLLSILLYLGAIELVVFFILFIKNYCFGKKEKEPKEEKTEDNSIKNYKPHFLKALSQEEIDDIHSRGKITPAEKVQEWESFGLCAPGDHLGSAAWRCKTFKTCHACLEDFASTYDEYSSFSDIFDSLKMDDIENIDFCQHKLDC